ncbi:MAG: 1-(5-phosphoribosyl)-5-[Clostridia bacterium]|nr:1-(5-phosphoribosyl)-5-[(5-phosphoribosylamino)methylideneamino]imidazole-4-carboxamide isomerase [Clostridia bacterium]
MKLFPAIDLYNGCAVRLYKGDYTQMTVYSEAPVSVALTMRDAGATCLHLVDLEGARDGGTPNAETVKKIVQATGMFVELGGGIRSMEVVDTYLSLGVSRVILGTAAVTDPAFLDAAIAKHGERIAVGVDIKDGKVAIKGWRESSPYTPDEFFSLLCKKGVRTVICTDISKDGAMIGTNRAMYAELAARYPSLAIIASGGVSSLDDISALNQLNIEGAIIGKAYYIGAIDLTQALSIVRNEKGAQAI